MLIISQIIQRNQSHRLKSVRNKIHQMLNFYWKKPLHILHSIKRKNQRNFYSIFCKGNYQKKLKERHFIIFLDIILERMIFIQDFITFSKQEKQRHIRTENFQTMKSGMEPSHREELLLLTISVVLVMRWFISGL